MSQFISGLAKEESEDVQMMKNTKKVNDNDILKLLKGNIYKYGSK